MSSQTPVPFGKYILLDQVAIGGMAEIFRAKVSGAANFEKIVAIKRIHPNMSEDGEFIKMFIDEAKIAGQLYHQNIAQIFELGRIEGHHFIAMEFIWGKDLLQILTKFKQQHAFMNPFQAAFIVSKICEGLDYAHKKTDGAGRPLNIVHRDISPQNILISYDGAVKIIDFGIAKARDRSQHTEAGVLKGKFAYMSPEQVRGLPIDRRSDVFALGTLLYEMLTSRPLFGGNTDLEVLEKVRSAEVVSPRTINPKIPPSLEKIVLKALSLEVEDRYQWASEMQEELEGFIYMGQPVYTEKRLGIWMKKVFARDLAKEKHVLKEMLDYLDQLNAQPDDDDEFEDDGETIMMLDAQNNPSILAATDVSEEKTMFLDDDDDDDEPNMSEEKTMFLDDDDDDDEPNMSEEKTMFLDDDDDDDEPNMSEEKTMFLDDDDDDDEPNMSEEKTMFLDDDDDDDDIPSSSFNPPLPLRPSPPVQDSFSSTPSIVQPQSSPTASQQQQQQQQLSSIGDLNKKNKILLFIVVAIVLILGIIVGVMLAPKQESLPPRTELVIVPEFAGKAVLVILDDSKLEKTLKPGEFLQTELSPGNHIIQIKGGGIYKDWKKSIDIKENSTFVKVVKLIKK